MATAAPAGGDAQFIPPLEANDQRTKVQVTGATAASNADPAAPQRVQDFLPPVVKAVVGCTILCGSFVLTLCTGIALIAVSSAAWTDDPSCEVPVREAALTLGLLEVGYWVAALAVSTVNAILQALTRGTRPRLVAVVNAAGTLSVVGILTCRLAVVIWATVTAFGGSRWSRYVDASPDFTCNRSLYRSFAVLIIVTWIAKAAFCLPVGCMLPFAVMQRRQEAQRDRERAIAAQAATGAAAASQPSSVAPSASSSLEEAMVVVEPEAGAASSNAALAADNGGKAASGGAAAKAADSTAAPSDVAVAVPVAVPVDVASDRSLDADAPNEPVDLPSPQTAAAAAAANDAGTSTSTASAAAAAPATGNGNGTTTA